MKIEIVIQRNILEDVLGILKSIDALKNTVIEPINFRLSGAFPHIDKVNLLTICNEVEKKEIIKRVFPIIHKYGGACIASNH